MGLRYEQLGDFSQLNPATSPPVYQPVFAYAKYALLTDYFYRRRQEVTTQFAAGSTNSQSSTGYAYNTQGWLASKTFQGGDNVLTRTRYKYLSDYLLQASTGSDQFMGMKTRVGEGISADVVETISEIRPAGAIGHVLYAGAALQTFAIGTALDATNQLVTTPTYPFQLFRWQPAQPVASYDSVQVVNNTLHVPATMAVVSTVLDVDVNLNPLSLRTEAGRQIAGKHLGYGGLVPLLQVANAKASEVIFSDFETTDKPYCFLPGSGVSPVPYPSLAAAHTGNQGCVLPAGSNQSTTLPASAATQYRLIFWARGTGLSGNVSVQPATTPSIAMAFTCAAQWQRYEMLLPLGSLTNRPAYQLAITAGPNNPVGLQIDDILLLPAEAAAASTTYSLVTGKTSETNARGRTTYYEYAATGDLALVRDHNQAITHQYQKVLPGQTLQSGISFTASGLMQENQPIDFTATATLRGLLQYKWDFGDNSTTPYSTYSTSIQAQHPYLVTGKSMGYNVRLTVSSQGQEYVYIKIITIAPTPLMLSSCTGGVLSINDCNHLNGTVNTTSCNPNNQDPNLYATYQVNANLSGSAYSWECTANNSPWQAVTAPGTAGSPIIAGTATSAAITIGRACQYQFRCRVTNGGSVYSEVFAINHYKSDLSCP